MYFRNYSLPLYFKSIYRICKSFLSSGDCNKEQYILKCLPKKPVPMSVAVIGANSCTGRASAVLFKREKIFRHMHLYDKSDITNVACDLRTVNSSPTIRYFYGLKQLQEAVSNVRIIYICGGLQKTPGFSEQDLFDKNASWVRQTIIYVTEFNPSAHVVICTPPVSYLVPMAVEEFRKSYINAEKRIYGMISHLVFRSNSLAGAHFKVKANSVNGFIVGGCHRRNFVPVFSHTHPGQNDVLIDNIQDAEDQVLRQKLREFDATGCCFSYAYSGVDFTTKLARALNQKPEVSACAFVKQQEPMDEYAKYFSCIVQLDKDGIKSCHIPKLSKFEKDRLKKIINNVKLSIYLGSSYVTGDDMIVVRKPVPDPKEKKIDDKKQAPEAKKDVKVVDSKKKDICNPCDPVRKITVPACTKIDRCVKKK